MIRLIDKCECIGKMLVNICDYHPDLKPQVDAMSIERRPQAGPQCAQFLSAQGSPDPRERFADTLPQCKDQERLGVQYYQEYGAFCLQSFCVACHAKARPQNQSCP